ncbi:MAG TPA: hypothetical protein VFV39_11105 [Limnobacter sp.]|nr:hypothetical protein [Limnobacter sp.]
MVKVISLGLICSLGACSNLQMSNSMQVQIEQNAVYTGLIGSDETPESCASFRVNESTVMKAIYSSIEISERVFQHELVGSNCVASGSFSNAKQKGKWTLDRACRLIIENEHGGVKYQLFRQCQQPLFYELDLSETSAPKTL